MDHQRLLAFVATVPGTIGQLFARQIAVNMAAAGKPEAGIALVEMVGLGSIPALATAGAPAPVLRTAIEHAMRSHCMELRGVDRPTFAAWCRQAEFSPPGPLPDVIDIYRGTMGCSPADAVTGLHWSLEFDKAAFYAVRFADTDLTGCIVLHARVHRDELIAFVSGAAGSEVVPATVPWDFEVVTDKDRIGDAGVRHARYEQSLAAKGWVETDSLGNAEAAAMAARARMAAAGVPRGAAIVA